jgi:circadian clock protein KaiB
MSTEGHAGDGCLLTLYVAGPSPRTDVAVANLHRLRGCCTRPSCEVSVVDVTERPDLAEAAHILATPTLIRERPLPVRRVVGDLSDLDQVMTALGIPAP